MGLNVWTSANERQSPRKIANTILELVCERCFLTQEEMLGRSRQERVAVPRMMAMALTRKFTSLTLRGVGEIYGARHHGTVIWAEGRHLEMLYSSFKYRDDMEAVVRGL